MKHLIRDCGMLFMLLNVCFATRAQRPTDVVKWTAEITGTKSDVQSAKLSATILDGWHVYALSQPAGGPTALRISIPSSRSFTLAGPVPESRVVRHFDPNFNMETIYYIKIATFNLSLKRGEAAPSETPLIVVRFQACNDRLCLPPYTTRVSAMLKRR
jgi:hypothetical protein